MREQRAKSKEKKDRKDKTEKKSKKDKKDRDGHYLNDGEENRKKSHRKRKK